MNRLKRFNSVCLLAFLVFHANSAGQTNRPLRLGVAGLSHGHLAEVTRRVERGDFIVVGASDPDRHVRENNGLRRRIDASLFYEDLAEMLDQTKPEVVVAYGSIYDHLSVVEACAPRGIHVMVEKPLAVNNEHAERMAELARKHRIHLLTNYETTWYSSNHESYRLIKADSIGKVTRINIYDGHQGPVEIRCSQEFLAWLTDPVLNGGGAVIDFGCYGANLATWLLNGEKPLSVYAILKQHKPDKYPKVDDDATIMVEYPSATVQIMGSWNWPMGRKDMHVYGSKGYIYQDTPTAMRFYHQNKEETITTTPLSAPYNDSFHYLKAVVRGEIQVLQTDLSSLENNLIVVNILDAAIQSAKTGKKIDLR